MSAMRLPERGSGKQVTLVLEHHDRLAASFARKCPRLRKHRPRRLALHVDAPERIVKEAQHRLQRQHPAYRTHRAFACGTCAAAHQLRQMFAIEAALHAHVDAGEECQPSSIAPVLRKPAAIISSSPV